MARSTFETWKFVIDRRNSNQWGLIIEPGLKKHNMVIFSISFNRKVCCVYQLEAILKDEAILMSTQNIHSKNKIRALELSQIY